MKRERNGRTERLVWSTASEDDIWWEEEATVDYGGAKQAFDESYYGAPNAIEFVIRRVVDAALGLVNVEG